MARISAIKKEFYSYLHSIEREVQGSTARLGHLHPDSPEIQKLREMMQDKKQVRERVWSEPNKDKRLNVDGVRLRAAELGMSLNELNRNLGFYKTWIYKALDRGRLPDDQLERLAEGLQTTVEEITQ